jgi:mono/diheme cytochrome c family protein
VKTDNEFGLQPFTAVFIAILVLLAFFLLNPAAFAHGWKSPEEDAKVKSQVRYSKASIFRGQESYLDLCSKCHGDNTRGGNPEKWKGKMTPPALVQRLENHSDGDFFWKIQNGRGDMPSFKEDIEPDEIWDIINFIRSLSKK